jgi:hypothetical protein
MNPLPLRSAVLALTLLGACADAGLQGGGQPRLIAQPGDSGLIDRVPLGQSMPAIAYDPDGCQNWIIDDGAEGYASRRRDPRSGLPVCNDRVPPGTVVNEYRTNDFPDVLPY